MSTPTARAETPHREGDRGAIARRAGVVAIGTLASRVLGAVRDSVVAASFPVAATDMFYVAFTIPNALRVLLGEGAMSGAFVPVFSEVRTREGIPRARAFYAALTGTMVIVLAVVTALGIAFAPYIVSLYAAGYQSDPSRFAVTVQLTRIVFPYIFFMGIAALGMGALNASKHFFVPAFAPALLNVAMIAAPFLFVPLALSLGLSPITALAMGALAGGLLQMIAQFPALRRVSLLSRPTFGISDPAVRKVLKLITPLLFGLGIYQLNMMLSRLFASFLPEGAQSYLYYGQRLVEIPQGMFAIAIASATLPTLATLRAQGEALEANRVFAFSLRLCLFLAIPSAVLLIVLAEPTITVLFARGNFGATDVRETAKSLLWQSAGIWAVSSVRTIVPAFHSYNDTRTPVISSGVSLAVFVAFSLLLMRPLEHVGLAIANSVAAVAQLLVLLAFLRRRTGPLGLRSVALGSLGVTFASLPMAVAAWAVSRLGDWHAGGNSPRNIVTLAGALMAGAGAFIVAARLLNLPEFAEAKRIVAARIRRTSERR